MFKRNSNTQRERERERESEKVEKKENAINELRNGK
jgi:hypothetical protein